MNKDQEFLWQPTALLRWKRVDIDVSKTWSDTLEKKKSISYSYNKILQQMWISNFGVQEWRDIPEED